MPMKLFIFCAGASPACHLLLSVEKMILTFAAAKMLDMRNNVLSPTSLCTPVQASAPVMLNRSKKVKIRGMVIMQQ